MRRQDRRTAEQNGRAGRVVDRPCLAGEVSRPSRSIEAQPVRCFRPCARSDPGPRRIRDPGIPRSASAETWSTRTFVCPSCVGRFSFQSVWFLVFPAGFGRPCMAGRCRRFDRRQGFSILSAAYGRLCGTVLRAFGYAARSLPEKRSSVPSEHRKNCRFAFRAADSLPSRAACVFCPDGKTGIGFRNRVIAYFKCTMHICLRISIICRPRHVAAACVSG